MRKEVKLGMVIGSGLIALLVVYLLVAPPNNKKGAGLANGDPAHNAAGSGGSEVAQPGDLTAEDQVGGRTLVSAPPAPDSGNTGAGTSGASKPAPSTTDAKADAGKTAAGTQVAGNADWGKTLDKGVPVAGTDPKPAGKTGTVGQGSDIERRATTTDRPSITAEAPVRMAHRDPNAAWGDGVSTDAPALGSIRTGGRAHLMAGGTPAPAPVTPTAAPGTARTHAIQPGDTLSSIAASAYGSATAYTHILKANPTLNPNNLKIGTVITLPAIDQVKAAGAAEHKTAGSASPGGSTSGTLIEPKIDPTRQYKVQSGDSLYKIAAKLYGKGTYADRIYERNKALIGSDPKRLKLGAVLELPEQPTLALPGNNTSANTPAQATPSGVNESVLQSGEAK